MISAIRRSGMPASARSTNASPATAASITTRRRCASSPSSSAATPAFDGLNLTWETLEGLVKHNGPLTDRDGRAVGRYAGAACRRRFCLFRRSRISNCGCYASAEAQVAALSDDIAYDAHDIDDGLRADLFTLDDIADGAADREHPGPRSTRNIRTLEPAAARA